MRLKTNFGPLGVLLALPLAVAASCTVSDKDDYTFDDSPSDGGDDQSGGTTGRGGRGGSAGTSGGSGGRGGTAGSGARGGSAGSGGSLGGEAGDAGAAGNGVAGDAGDGGGGAPGGAGGAGGSGAEDPCDPDPCEHGDCSPDGEDYDCDCDDGYDGTRCQNDIDDCASDPCENGGACDDGVDAYTCDCDGTGYAGDRCQTPVGATCADDPCVNGTCNDEAGGTYSCDCGSTGYQGTNCDLDVDDCASRPCQNGGTCTDTGVNSYACACQPGYDGRNCEGDVNDCATNPCEHGGRCTDAGTNNFSCDCSGTGWTGTTCSCNSQVLFLDDSPSAATADQTSNAAIETLLENGGLTVTRVVSGAWLYAGAPAASGFGAVLLSPGDGSSFNIDMPAAGQTSVFSACSGSGTGFVTTEWAAYNVGAGRYATISTLTLLARSIEVGFGADYASVFTLTASGHPIWAGTPTSYTSNPSLTANQGHLINEGVAIATCPTCSDSETLGPALAVREASGSRGRAVHHAHAGNYNRLSQVMTPWYGDANNARIFVNSVKWATRCF